MRIALNLIGFQPAGTGGTETYVRNLLHYLQLCDQENDYLVLCDEVHAGELPLFNPRFMRQTVRFHKGSINWLLRGIAINLVGVDMLAVALRKLSTDVVHHPFTTLNPRGLALPSVLTFHDMQHEFFPEFFSRHELRLRRRGYPASVAEAGKVIAISGHVGKCLVDRYKVEGNKVAVVHSGCGSEYRVIRDPSALKAVRERYGLTRPFLFYPAATWPHKNHQRLLETIATLAAQGRFDGDLVLTGIPGQGDRDIRDAIDRLGLTGRVKILGYLPGVELPLLYNLATTLVFPSLFEGFGLPVVEAMACGCPVVCSDIASLSEVAGNAAVTFDPLSVEDMAVKVGRVWHDSSERGGLKEKGLVRGRMFSWEKTALATLAVYRQVVESCCSGDIDRCGQGIGQR